MSTTATIAFAGTPEFAVPALSALLAAGLEVPLVLTQPDRAAGRGRRVAMSPIKQLALSRGLRVEQPEKLPRVPHATTDWPSAPDLLVVAAYGLILPQWLLDWPRVAAVNIHASLLPRWRGASPIQHAILAGDRETGISIMKMEAGLDAGPVYQQERTVIGPTETAGELHDRLAEIGARALMTALPQILDGSLRPVPQDESLVTFAPKIAKQQARLDWHDSAAALARRVRAFLPWPVAEGRLDDGRILRIWRAQPIVAPPAEPGRILAEGATGIDVATADGCLRIEMLQPPGARPMSAQAYLNAHSLKGHHFVP